MHQKQQTFCFRTALATAIGLHAFEASASETITYTYDALGRLVAADTTGSVNNGRQMDLVYDAADNRMSYEVSGSTNKVVVVPLNGFTVIPLKDD